MDSPVSVEKGPDAKSPLMNREISNVSKLHLPMRDSGNRSQLELEIEKLSLGDVLGWSPEDCGRFLDIVQLPEYKGIFLENRICGKVLVLLTESHLKEIGMTSIGHRLVLDEALAILRKKRKEYERNMVLWEGVTPSSCYYTQSTFQCCCYPCYYKTYWSFSRKGITTKPDRGACWTCLTCNCTRPRKTNYTDYRLLKDVELMKVNTCCCCCQRNALHLVAANQYNAEALKKGLVGDEEIKLFHPDAPRVEELVRNAWQKVRLVDAGAGDGDD